MPVMKAAAGNVWTIARKELRGYFGSAVAVIFLATFLAVTLFTFFWVEKFFARGVADLRQLGTGSRFASIARGVLDAR